MRDKVAWDAYDSGNFKEAALVWEKLIKNCEKDCEDVKLGYGYALTKLKRFDEARKLYQNLFEETKHHVYLHQMGMVEREAENHKIAQSLFLKEQTLVRHESSLAKAANLYELALLEKLLGNQIKALELAHDCLNQSRQTTDFVMQGCAYRLLADSYSLFDESQAKENYRKAKHAFRLAEDRVAMAEIEEKLQSLR